MEHKTESSKKRVLAELRAEAVKIAHKQITEPGFKITILDTVYKVGGRIAPRSTRPAVVWRWSPLMNEWLVSARSFDEIFQALFEKVRKELLLARREMTQ